jgi:hypothetical protein
MGIAGEAGDSLGQWQRVSVRKEFRQVLEENRLPLVT